MKPIALIQHAATDGPGHFAIYAERHALPVQVFRADVGEMPANPRQYSGLVLMGGPMSAYDDLPWIPRVVDFIRQAMAAEIPVLGHCLGGQFMALAMGGKVTKNPVKEIGWHEVEVADHPVAVDWFGDLKRFTTFEWHGDTFSLPVGATRLLSSPACEQQAFACGPHLALQCHVEMDPELIDAWCATGDDEIAESRGPTVQSTAEIRRELGTRLAALSAIADRLYDRWTAALAV